MHLLDWHYIFYTELEQSIIEIIFRWSYDLISKRGNMNYKLDYANNLKYVSKSN